MTAHPWPEGRARPRRLRAVPVLLALVLAAAPAAALDTVYLVRHAERVEEWPRELDAYRPLTPAGAARAESLAERLKDAGIAAVYTSVTTRTMATGMPLAVRIKVPLRADDRTTQPGEMAPFLARLREAHAADRAVLLVGHSNTVPKLLIHLGARPDCYARLGIEETADGPMIEGYEGMWKVDLRKQGCEAFARE